MSLATLDIPKEYGYVLLATSASGLVAMWHGARVGGYRKRAQIVYPQLMAAPEEVKNARPGPATKKLPSDPSTHKPTQTDLYLFNCAQRAHANFLETYPIFLPTVLISGLKFPMWASGLGAFYLVNRIIYAVGYTNENMEKGKGRLYGSGYFFGLVGLLGLSIKTAVDVIRS